MEQTIYKPHSGNDFLADVMLSCLSHGSLFSGIGGFDLAAQWMGWNNIFQCEKDEWCRKVLAKNFPYTKRFEDIKEFNAKEYNGTIDVISGGFPCQPFSVAGQRKGKDDDRYLWAEMLRVISTIKPTYVVGENVTGIIGLALDTVLSDLETQGYTTETFIIPACSKNAWHRRDRVWIIAYTNSIGRHDEQKENGKSVCNEEWNDTIEKQGREQQQCRTGKSSSVFPNATSSGARMEEHRSSGQGWEQANKCEPKILRQENGEACSKGINASSRNVSANTDNTGCEEQRQPITDGAELFAPKCSSWWEVEPGVGRVVDGLPNRVDRLKGLGNAIVPQVAFELFKALESVHRHGA
jgi:DNA (cytosine-5)-methyltransferase 1